MIRKGSEQDSGRIAAIHCREISSGFLSQLGPGFLARLYRFIAKSPHSFIFVSEEKGRVNGFIAGSTDSRRLYREFCHALPLSIFLALLARMADLNFIRAALSIRKHMIGKAAGAQGAELLSIAVSREFQRKGIGCKLVRALSAEIKSRGRAECRVLVGKILGNARFYESAGFKLRSRTADGRSNIYTLATR